MQRRALPLSPVMSTLDFVELRRGYLPLGAWPLDAPMRRIVHHRLGQPSELLRVEECPSGPLGSDQVRVRVSCAPIHPGDLLGVLPSVDESATWKPNSNRSLVDRAARDRNEYFCFAGAISMSELFGAFVACLQRAIVSFLAEKMSFLSTCGAFRCVLVGSAFGDGGNYAGRRVFGGHS